MPPIQSPGVSSRMSSSDGGSRLPEGCVTIQPKVNHAMERVHVILDSNTVPELHLTAYLSWSGSFIVEIEVEVRMANFDPVKCQDMPSPKTR